MRKPYPGIGAIKLLVEVIFIDPKKKIRSYWNAILSVKQARDFVYKGTGKLPGSRSFYYLKPDGKVFRIPTALKHTVVPHTVGKYETRNFHIKVSPHANTKTAVPDGQDEKLNDLHSE